MRQGGFNTYLTKEKKRVSLYRYEYKPSGYQDTELRGHIGKVIGSDILKYMGATVRGISGVVVNGIMKGENKRED